MSKKLTATSYQKAIICMVLAYISIALMGVFVKYASDELPSSEILFSRFLIGFIFLLPFMIRDGVNGRFLLCVTWRELPVCC